MRFATVATGAVNGYLAVKLAQSGGDVACLARGAHRDAIRARGLKLREADGETVVRIKAVSEDPAALGPADVVIFAVKGQDLDAVAPMVKPLLGPETFVIPLLNGVEAAGRLEAHLGEGRVLEGYCAISVFIPEPGVIARTGGFAKFRFAERDGTRSERALRAADALTGAGIDAGVPEDIQRELWLKFLMLASMSGVTAAARCTAGQIRASAELTRLTAEAVAEVGRLARAEGVAITEADEARTVEAIKAMPAQMRASQAMDLTAGRSLEVDWLSGAVARLSEAQGLEAPVHRALHAVLSPFKAGGAKG